MNLVSIPRLFLISFIFAVILLTINSMPAKAGKDTTINKLLTQNGYRAHNLTNINGFLYIDGFVGKKPIRAIIDTGSNEISILTDSISKLKGLKLTVFKTDQKSMNSSGRVTAVEKVTLPDLTIADIKEKKLHAAILDLPQKNEWPTLVIGNHFLQKYHAIIDTHNNKIYFRTTKLPKKNMIALQHQLKLMQLEKIPLTTSSSGAITLPVKINNENPVSFLFDTGTGITLISEDYYNTLKTDKKTNHYTRMSNIDFMTMNPLNTFFQKPVIVNNITVQVEDLSSMTRYLDVLGIIGLPQMIKSQALIFSSEGVTYMKSL